MIAIPSLNVLNVLLIQIKMVFHHFHLLLSTVHVVHSSRDELKLIIELYENDVRSFVDVLELYQRSISRDDKGSILAVNWWTDHPVSCKTKNQY